MINNIYAVMRADPVNTGGDWAEKAETDTLLVYQSRLGVVFEFSDNHAYRIENGDLRAAVRMLEPEEVQNPPRAMMNFGSIGRAWSWNTEVEQKSAKYNEPPDPEDTLTPDEQRAIRQYIRDRADGKDICIYSLPGWLANLERIRQDGFPQKEQLCYEPVGPEPAAVSEWYRVEDHLPKDETLVMAKINIGKAIVGRPFVRAKHKGGRWFSPDIYPAGMLVDVTHWAHYPSFDDKDGGV